MNNSSASGRGINQIVDPFGNMYNRRLYNGQDTRVYDNGESILDSVGLQRNAEEIQRRSDALKGASEAARAAEIERLRKLYTSAEQEANSARSAATSAMIETRRLEAIAGSLEGKSSEALAAFRAAGGKLITTSARARAGSGGGEEEDEEEEEEESTANSSSCFGGMCARRKGKKGGARKTRKGGKGRKGGKSGKGRKRHTRR
jgi:hypothetical protein